MFPSVLNPAVEIHARLTDRFIAAVSEELSRADDAFARDSLSDLLDHLEDQRSALRPRQPGGTVPRAA